MLVQKMKTLTCLVPARNEAGHLSDVIGHVLSVPEISQIIIIEGGSTDNTWEAASQIKNTHPGKVELYKQDKRGKFNAVLHGAIYAKGNHIVIWDADGTVPIEDSKKVIASALSSGGAAMGNRLKGNIESGAMQAANYLGNWAFALAWAPILRSKPKDLLCGTKVFPKEVFTEMPDWLSKIDPYGDFALISHAIARGISIQSITVNYKARVYGETNIHRWRGGVQLLRTTFAIYFAFVTGKFKKIH